MTTSGRPEQASYTAQQNVPTLGTAGYLTKHFFVGVAAETAFNAQKFASRFSFSECCLKTSQITGLDTLAARALASLPSLPTLSSFKFFDAVTSATQTASNVTKAAGFSVPFASASLPAFIAEGLEKLSKMAEPLTSIVGENNALLLNAGGVALSAALINRMAAKRIQNAYVRNVVSALGGAVAVWGAHTALSSCGISEHLAFSKAVDMSVRMLAAHVALNYVALGAQSILKWNVGRVFNVLRTPYAYSA